jgi:hypothetical protein
VEVTSLVRVLSQQYCMSTEYQNDKTPDMRFPCPVLFRCVYLDSSVDCRVSIVGPEYLRQLRARCMNEPDAGSLARKWIDEVRTRMDRRME